MTFESSSWGTVEGLKYTTNKGILLDDLIEEMRDAYRSSEEFLDLEKKEEKSIVEKQREQLQRAISRATPEQVQKVLPLVVSAIPDSEGSNK